MTRASDERVGDARLKVDGKATPAAGGPRNLGGDTQAAPRHLALSAWRQRRRRRKNPTPVEAVAHRLRTQDGKKLCVLRKQVPEPVFGIIKSVLGFRQYLLRGLDCVRGEWRLVTMAWNMKRMFALCPAQ